MAKRVIQAQVADPLLFEEGKRYLKIALFKPDGTPYSPGGGEVGPQGAQGVAGPEGPAGPQGPAGATGAAGAQGPLGPAGANGTGFRWRGNYNPATAYAVDDVVAYTGSSFIAVLPTTGVTPDDASPNWDLIAIAGPPGPQGPAGANGAAGAAGSAGAQGPQGPAGSAGPAGSVGPAGAQGPKGDPGDPGADGAGTPAIYFTAKRAVDTTLGAGYTGPMTTPEVEDSHGFYNGQKFQPTEPGWYRLSGKLIFDSSAGNPVEAYLVKNFSTPNATPTTNIVDSDLAVTRSDGWASLNLDAVVYFNGTTDYVVLYCWLGGTGGTIRGTSNQPTHFEGHSIGAAGPAGPEGPPGPAGSGGAGGPALLVAQEDFVDVGVASISGLLGDDDPNLKILIDGVITTTGDIQYGLRFNDDAVNSHYRSHYTLMYSGGSGIVPEDFASNRPFLTIGQTGYSTGGHIFSVIDLSAKSGRSRLANYQGVIDLIGGNEELYNGSGVWNNTADELTDLALVLQGSATFTGRISVFRTDGTSSISSSAAGDPSVLEVVDLTGQTSYVFDNLDGDADVEYVLEYEGRMVPPDATRDRYALVRANSIPEGGAGGQWGGQTFVGMDLIDDTHTGGYGSVGNVVNRGWILGQCAWNGYPAEVAGRMTIQAARRASSKRIANAVYSSGPDIVNIHTLLGRSAGYWYDNTTKITSLLVDFDGSAFTGRVVLKRLNRASDVAGSGGGGSPWVYDSESTNVASITIPDLDGDADVEYEVVIDGDVVPGGAARNITLRPNGATSGTHFAYVSGGVDASGPGVGVDIGILVGYTPTANSRILARGLLSAKSGRKRMYSGTYHHGGQTSANDGNVGTFGGRWDDTAANLVSLDVHFGGGTFTGRVRVKKV